MRRVFLFVVFAIVSLTAKANYIKQDGIYYIIEADGLWVGQHEYKGDIVIPSTVTYEGTEYVVVGIGDDAFWRCFGLTSITIPNSVTTIGNSAFGNCTSLTSITIPNSVTSIGDEAFWYCSSLTSITIPNSVTSVGSDAFRGCSCLTSITIPNSVTSIGRGAFEGCSGLTSITIPNNVTSIGSDAFAGCTSLASITIPNSVTSIGYNAFGNCTSLTSITIPNSVTSIGSGAFEGCSSLKSVTLHCSEIGSCFSNKSSIQEINIGEEVTSIGNNAFKNCTSLTSITIGNSVTSIGSGAFAGCTSLSSVVIPNSVTTIGAHAFEYCTSLSYIYLPSSITEIGFEAFLKCTSLLSVDIHATSVKGWAFRSCTHLKTVNLYNSVKTFTAGCVDGCAGLISITSNNPNPPDTVEDFASDITRCVILYVPKGSEEVYRKTYSWSIFRTIKAIGEDGDTDNTNTDDKTTDDNNTDDDKTDDGISDGDSGWSINIKIKGEDIAQCSIDNIESIEFTEDGLYIIINYKDGKSAKYDMSKFESIDFSEKGGNNEDVDDVETNEGSNQEQMSLKIDDESFYAVNCTAEQTSNSGMYLHIKTAENLDFPYFGKELTVHISPSKVAELKEGDVFDTDKMSVRYFGSVDQIYANSSSYNELEGDITIKKISSMEMTIEINDLVFENKTSKVKHKISGTAVLTSGVYDSKGNLLSFKDAIE